MSHTISRRDWLKLVGGSAIGFVFTPIPWKILDESAKWTQSSSFPYGRHREAHLQSDGRISFRYTTCTLCPMACGVRVRCAADGGRGSLEAVGMTGTPGHPIGGGSLCAMGLAGHFLRYHPDRVGNPVKRTIDKRRFAPVPYDEAISNVVLAISASGNGSVAILDSHPDRTISYVYRDFLGKLKNGIYVIPPSCDSMPTTVTDRSLNTGGLEFGYDLINSRTIVSFGTPILDGWGTQGQFGSISEARRHRGQDKLRLIQIEPIHSRTAQLADEWIPVRPGTEYAFALAMAHVMVHEKLCDIDRLRRDSKDFDGLAGNSFVRLIERFSPKCVAEMTGIPADRIAAAAKETVTRRPSVVVFGGNPASGPFRPEEQAAFMGLNILLGSIGTRGGLVARRELPGPFPASHGSDNPGHLAVKTQLADVPDGSIGVLIIDGADSGSIVPWQAIQRKLSADRHLVVSLTSYLAGNSVNADYILPSPAYLEMSGDVPTPPSAPFASYSLASRVFPGPATAVSPLDFVKRTSAALSVRLGYRYQSYDMESLLRKRAEKIFSRGIGRVFNAETGENEKLTALSLSQFWNMLSGGGCWIDEVPAKLPTTRFAFLDSESRTPVNITSPKRADSGEIALMPVGTRGIGTAAQSNPIMSKLNRESDLRMPAGTVSLNPVTGEAAGLKDGVKARVLTTAGSMTVKVRFDRSAMPGTILAAVGDLTGGSERTNGETQDSILQICKIENDSTWRITNAAIEPA